MIVTFMAAMDCPDCGQPLTGFRVSTVRVALKWLRCTSPCLIFWPRCEPCGYTLPDDAATKWRLEPEHIAKVEAAKAKIRARRKAAA